jgi:transcriptional regulator GlxA family with amidase domain
MVASSLGGGRINLFPALEETSPANKIDQCIAYMQQNVNRPLQVAMLAAQARLSPSHFFALFKKRTGCPPMNYFIRLRMRHACRLFDSTSVSVKEAAAALGYDDPFYFSRVFKLVNKIPPSAYRRRAREIRSDREKPVGRNSSGGISSGIAKNFLCGG